MKLGIMQPYFFPYIGYWQLINAVDVYVIYDDVQYIKGGWINRNRILDGNGGSRFLNVYLQGASVNKLIREIKVDNDPKLKEKTLSMVRAVYNRAPYFDSVYPMLDEIMRYDADNIAEFNAYLIRRVCEYLGINTKLVLSSDIDKDISLKGRYKVLNICRIMGATEYYNAVGGKLLYDKDEFMSHGIRLGFIQSGDIRYQQYDDPFHENLSIIDVMMFNDVDSIQKHLSNFVLE